MAESISPELELECLRVLLSAPDNYQREIRARVRKLLLAAQSPEQAEEFVQKYLVRIRGKIAQNAAHRDTVLGEEAENSSHETETTATGEPVSQKHKSEDEE